LKSKYGQVPRKIWLRVSGLESRRLWSELTNTQSELTNTQSELTNTQSELTNTQSELTNTQSELTNTQSELTNTQSELTNTQSELTNTQSELTNTQSELTNTQSELTNTQSELTNTQSELTNTQSELTNTQSELTNTQSELTNTQSELHFLRNAIKQLSQEIIQLFGTAESNTPKKSVDVTVVIATKDRPKLLLRALTSINQQSRLPLEVIIINNGEKFSNKENDNILLSSHLISKVQLIDAQDLLDVSSCRDLGLRKVTTKYATYLDDDNIMWPRWVENGFDFLSKSNFAFVYGAQLREDSQYLFQEFSDDKIRENNFIDTNSIMHESSFGRWTPGVSRLSDWSFVLNFISDNPEKRITSLPAISTIYKVDAPNRISTSLYSPYKVLMGLLHKLIPETEAILKLESKYCIICCNSNVFVDGPNERKGASCPDCGSLERHRVLKIFLESFSAHLAKSHTFGKVIEAAPSSVSRELFSIFGSNYASFDLDPSADGRECDFVADICDMPLEGNSVGLFVALHVLEHVQNDRIALNEISRVLKPLGICLLQVPLAKYRQPTQEGLIEDDLERISKYGQIDHVRLYGEDIIDRIQESGMIATFISIEDFFPPFLINVLGLRDDMKFILSVRDDNSLSRANFEDILQGLQIDFGRLAQFCKLFD
jgi:SAM-dependent methyltransferase/predicted nuclease with TOPRIM domain